MLAPAISLPAANLTTTAIQGIGADWTAAIWQTNGNGALVGMGTNASGAFTNTVGNTYEMVQGANPAYGFNTGTRLRGPQGGTGATLSFTFPGDSLTVGPNAEFRFGTGTTTSGQPGTNIFPGTSGNPGLILKGGVMDTRQANTLAYVGGLIRVDAQSYFSHANNGGAGPNANATWTIYGQLTGTNNLVVFGGNATCVTIISGLSNTFSGQWFLKAGLLVGSGTGSLGTNSITVDPQYALPWSTAVNTAGPALLEVNYDLNSAGGLTLTNGGQMQLHQNCCFSHVTIEGTSLSLGIYPYSTLNSAYPLNFPAGGSGSITVQPYDPGTNAAPSYIVSPNNGPAAGSNLVAITASRARLGNGSDITNVTVCGVAAVRLSQTTNSVTVRVGAGSAGTGEILIQSASQGTTTVQNGYTYNPAGSISSPFGVWGAINNLPAARGYLGVAAGTNGLIYAVGGRDASGIAHSTVYAYNPLLPGNGWSSVTSLPAARGSLAAATDTNGLIYAIGGGDAYGIAQSTVYAYSPLLPGNGWSSVSNLPAARFGLAAAAVNGKLYAIGGRDLAGNATNSVYVYDPAQPAAGWSSVSNLPAARYYPAAAGVNGKLYVIGGMAPGGWITQTSVYVYDPAQPTAGWSSMSSLPSERDSLGAASVNGKLYAIAGENNASVAQSAVYLYDPAQPGAGWASASSLPVSCYGLGAASAYGQIYAVGGMDASGSANNSAYQDRFTGTVSPAFGTIDGGTTVTISGINLGNGDVTSVTLCGIPAVVVTDGSPTQIVVATGATTTPTNGDVVVTSTSYGVTTATNAYSYLQLGPLDSIPAAALKDPRYALGYLVVTYYPGVTNNGTGDCRMGIQNAIDHAFAACQDFQDHGTNRPLAVLFPPGTYQISDILECYQWEPSGGPFFNGHHVLIGSTEGTNRPVIKLASGAANYQDSGAPRQMISFRKFQGGTDTTAVPVPDPMSVPTGYIDFPNNLFWDELRNIDFDCNHNPGAVGVVFPACQYSAIVNVRVDATGAFAGFCALPGAGGCSANIEVEGGQYGIMHGRYSTLGVNVPGSSGPTIAGLKLQNQTVQAMKVYDAISPVTVVGFQITNSKSVVAMNGNWNILSGSLTLVDGQIGISGGGNIVAIDNSYGRNLYVRNVYVTGTTNLVKSGSTTTRGAGARSLIKEYSYNCTLNVANVPPNTGYAAGAYNFESYSLINGTFQDQTVAFPVAPNILTNCGAPPSDLVSRHLWANFPSYNGSTNDPPTVVVSTNAAWNNTSDDTVMLQAAIDQANTSNGRVFLPGGDYYITNTLTLYANTVLMGAGWQNSRIRVNPKWQPTTGEVTMLRTVDDAGAATTLAWLTVRPRRAYTAIETNYSRFNVLTWRAGGKSLVLDAEMEEPYMYYGDTQPRSHVRYTGNGGGRWYTMGLAGNASYAVNKDYRKLTILNTSQPLWFYGFNIEHGAGDEEVDIFGSSNVRMVGWKREGNNAMLVISNSSNIALFTAGDMLYEPAAPYFQVLGGSTNILLANLCVEQMSVVPLATDTMIYESLAGQPVNTVLWPNMVSLYKRGELNDAAMFITVITPPVFAPPVVTGGKLALTGTGGSPGGTYCLLASTNLALSGWTAVLTNTFGSDGRFSNAISLSPSTLQYFYRLRVP